MCVDMANFYFTGVKAGIFYIISLQNFSISVTILNPTQGNVNPLIVFFNKKNQ